jgi:hypothetical protein
MMKSKKLKLRGRRSNTVPRERMSESECVWTAGVSSAGLIQVLKQGNDLRGCRGGKQDGKHHKVHRVRTTQNKKMLLTGQRIGNSKVEMESEETIITIIICRTWLQTLHT